LTLTEIKRIIAIDYGEKRVGIAITDPLRIFAYPLITLNNDSALLQNINKLLNEYDCERIILGYPLKESGEHSSSTKIVIEFKEELSKATVLPIDLVDERYSSSIAQQRIIESVPSKKKRRDKSLVDKNAACIILEDYLAALNK
jgi:putative Holliday junction resolvase